MEMKAENWVMLVHVKEYQRLPKNRGSYEIGTGFPGGSNGKESTCSMGELGSVPGWDDPLEEGMATHSSMLVLENPMDRGAWRATVYGVTQSQTQLSN